MVVMGGKICFLYQTVKVFKSASLNRGIFTCGLMGDYSLLEVPFEEPLDPFFNTPRFCLLVANLTELCFEQVEFLPPRVRRYHTSEVQSVSLDGRKQHHSPHRVVCC